MITGPQSHFVVMQAALCDAWPRCRNSSNAQPAAVQPYIDKTAADMLAKADAFSKVLEDCASWANKTENGVLDMPSLQFQLTGPGGAKKTVNLPGHAYIFETVQQVMETTYVNIPFFGRMPIRKEPTGETKIVCAATFQPMEYNTEQNGPVFILGLPLFYEYEVSYNLAADPPEVSFASLEDEPCGSCDGAEELGLAETGARLKRPQPRSRQVFVPPRNPSVDITQPL